MTDPLQQESRARPALAPLIDRMRAGERAAVGTFIQHYGDRIRRRVRAKLRPAMRRLFDSAEILSTLGRRLDACVADRRLLAASEGEFWSLVLTISDHALIDKGRVFQRLSDAEGEDGPVADALRSRLSAASRRADDGDLLELDTLLSSFRDPDDRRLLALWLQGVPHTQIADELGISAAAVRKRWQAIREELRTRLSGRRDA